MATFKTKKTLNEVNKHLHPSTNPEILVKIGPLGSELPGLESRLLQNVKFWQRSGSSFSRLTNGNCDATCLQFDGRRPFVTLAFENRLEYWNFDYSILIRHQFSILCEILVRFGLVTPEFKT